MIPTFFHVNEKPPKDFTHVSIFDLDHSLITTNASRLFGEYLRRKRWISLPSYLLTGLEYIKHKYHLIDSIKLHQAAFTYCFSSLSPDFILEHVRSFFYEKLEKILYQPVFFRFKNAHNEGHCTILMSNSPDFIVQHIAEELGFHLWAATPYLNDENDKFTLPRIALDGLNKKKYIDELIVNLQLSKDNLSAYSDSIDDFPLLANVGIPIAVNPDKALLRYSLQNNWLIL